MTQLSPPRSLLLGQGIQLGQELLPVPGTIAGGQHPDHPPLRPCVGAPSSAAFSSPPPAALAAAATVRTDLPTIAALLAAGVVTSLLSAVVLAPAIAHVVVHVVGACYPVLFGTVGRLSRGNTLRNPRRTGATAAALMIGLSLVGATTVLAARSPPRSTPRPTPPSAPTT